MWHPPSRLRAGVSSRWDVLHQLLLRGGPTSTRLGAGVARTSSEAEPPAQGTAFTQWTQGWDTMQGWDLPLYVSSLQQSARKGKPGLCFGKARNSSPSPAAVFEGLGLCTKQLNRLKSTYKQVRATAFKNRLVMVFESLTYLIKIWCLHIITTTIEMHL